MSEVQFNRPRRRVALIGGAAFIALTLAACSTGGTEEPEASPTAEGATAEEVISSAETEGAVVVYTSFPDGLQQALNEAFTETYGIEVQSERLIQSAFTQRVQAEFEAGQEVVDVLIGSDMAAYDIWSEEERFVPLPEEMPAVSEWPEHFRDEFRAFAQSNQYGILYNTDLVSEADVPESWEDLLDDQYTGQVLLLDPAAGTASQYQYNALLQEYGEEFLSDLGDQGSFVESGVPASQSVGAGAAQIYVPAIPPIYTLAVDAGLPVGIVYPEPSVAGNTAIAAPVTAPHPNAAKVFIDYVLSPEGQEIINAGGFSALAGLTGIEQLPDSIEFADHVQTVENAETIISLLKD